MSEHQVIVRIEKISGGTFATKQVTIDCRDAAHAESVGKLLTSCAEQEKEIALTSAGEKNV